ncbi:MAG TPA: sigma-70 family RNA polymerase sigma factor [Terriglobales bacterium]|nr:sigma-70 family RNA polymerase sigma factor [Terriglobales bacterium]
MSASENRLKQRQRKLKARASSDGVAQVAGGDTRPEALAELARNHHTALVRYLMVRTGSMANAEDVAQEAYAKVLALDQPGTISFAVGYLWRVAGNLAIDRRRREEVGDRIKGDLQQEEEDFGPSSETVAEWDEQLAIVEQAIDELPPRCRAAFILRVLKGKSFREVGCDMNISTRMAEMHVARALEYLQSRLNAADEAGSRR